MSSNASITYLEGDATAPVGEGRKIIAHICANRNGWGKGFVLAISKRWAQPENHFRSWASGLVRDPKEPFKLGGLQCVQVERDIVVANMVAQNGFRSRLNPKPISYDALEECFAKLAIYAIENSATVHMPRIGTGLAGGTWTRIEPLIHRCLIDIGVNVTVYDL